MTNSKRWLVGILGVIVAAGFWTSLDWRPLTATGAPLAQALGTSTPIIKDGPAGSGNIFSAGVVIGVAATPGAAGTPGVYQPVNTDGNGRLMGSVNVTVIPVNGYTTPVVSVATVGATPGLTPVVAANSARVYLYCTNDNATSPIYLKPGGTPVVGAGIRLNTNGGSYEMSAHAGSLYTGPVYAVATQTTASLICEEGSN